MTTTNTNTTDIDTRWENAEFVATTDMDEEWDFSVEFRKEADGNYLSKFTEDGEETICEHDDYQKILDYQRDAIRGFWQSYAEGLIEQTADGRKYTVDEEKLDKMLDKMTAADAEANQEYALQYYYIDSENRRDSRSGDADTEALEAYCLGSDEDECILSCVTFEEEQEEEDEE